MEEIKANLEKMGFTLTYSDELFSFFTMKDLSLSLNFGFFRSRPTMEIYWNGSIISSSITNSGSLASIEVLYFLHRYFVLKVFKPVRFKYYEALINANLEKNATN